MSRRHFWIRSYSRSSRGRTAIRGAKDGLLGLKENIIIGHLIPAGTGMYRYQDVELDVEAPVQPLPVNDPLLGSLLSPGPLTDVPVTAGFEDDEL